MDHAIPDVIHGSCQILCHGILMVLVGATRSIVFSSILLNSLNAIFTLFQFSTDQSVLYKCVLISNIFSLVSDLLSNSRKSEVLFV